MRRVTNRVRFLATAAALATVTACSGSDGGMPAARALTPPDKDMFMGRYSPDGARIAYGTRGQAGEELWVADADGGNATRLATAEFVGDIVWAPDSRRVAFGSSAASAYDTWVVDASGGTPERVSEAPGFDFPLWWHPSGERLVIGAFVEGGKLVCNALTLATGDLVPLVPSDPTLCGSWSPDGSTLAVQRITQGGFGTIGVADSAGHDVRWLTTEGFEQLATEPWSPDGHELLYMSRRTGTEDVWVLPLNGDAPRQLTRDVRRDFAPRWSSDGQWVAFLSQRGRQTDVWVVPAQGGTELRVTDDEVEEEAPHWRAGTADLAFQTGAPTSGVWAMSLDDSSERRLTPETERATSAKVSRDGTQIAYRVQRGGGVTDLEVMPVAGGTPRALTSGTSINTAHQWSPDGSTIAFISDRAGSRDVWTVPAAGGEAHRLVDWPSEESDPEWSFDGAWVYFLSDHESAGQLGDVWRVAAGGGEPQRVTRTGTVTDVEPSPVRDELSVYHVASRGQFRLSLVPGSGGDLQPLWEQSNVYFQSDQPFSPSGDSLAALVEIARGRGAVVLLPVAGGSSYRTLVEDHRPWLWSPDGSQMFLLLRDDRSQGDIGVLTLADGAVHRLTSTPQNEFSPYWADGGRTVVFNRVEQHRQLVTVDLAAQLAAVP